MPIETKIKRQIYILLAMVLGFLLSLIFYALLEKAYINRFISVGELPSGTRGESFLPPSVGGVFFIGGMILGYVLGVRWWQIVYVEKRHWKNRHKE
jgi:UDP-N-acetylmuramyl pentapeptide phosphotransferase/UDP-N-acetylglucosamine-1-phosphate transferase